MLFEDEYKAEEERVLFLNDSTALVDGETLWYVDSSSVVNEQGIDYYVFSIPQLVSNLIFSLVIRKT